nr:hypothetical protein [Actinomadura terrae]
MDDSVSTLDLIGSHWTLFSGRNISDWRAAAHLNPHVHTLDTDGVVLVRPDGFVAWQGTTEDSLRASYWG